MGFRCGPCPPGFKGDGVHCQRLNLCSSRPCFPNVTCQEDDQSPGYRCGDCPLGYTGNGVDCQDINECADGRNGGCVENSRCINKVGSFQCGDCLSGFTGNQSVGCQKERQTVCLDGTVCHEHAFCVKRKGFVNYVCQCRIGWAGDGKVCGTDSDLDGWCDYDLSCRDRRCQKVTKHSHTHSNAHS